MNMLKQAIISERRGELAMVEILLGIIKDQQAVAKKKAKAKKVVFCDDDY